MRKDNYLIAMFNKDILDLSIPILGKRQWMTQLMQDYLAYGIFSFMFDANGKFRKRFLKASNKTRLTAALQNRFQTMVPDLLLGFNHFVMFSIFVLVFDYSVVFENFRGVSSKSIFGWRSQLFSRSTLEIARVQ